jgi:hypothetical protein
LPIVQPELNAELNAMSDDEFAAILGAADQQVAQQLARAQACLDLFEKDRGRRANNALDIRVWADVQVPENLRFRILRRLRTAEVWTEACKRIWNDIPAPLASRTPMGQRIFFSLTEAAKTTGLSESTILAAIEDGRIAGIKDMLNGWYVERAQLCHVFPPAPAGPAKCDTDNCRALDATALMLEVGISALVRMAGDKLRRRSISWRLLPRIRPEKPATRTG